MHSIEQRSSSSAHIGERTSTRLLSHFCRPPASARYLYCTLPYLNTNNNAKPKTKRTRIQGTIVDGGWVGGRDHAEGITRYSKQVGEKLWSFSLRTECDHKIPCFVWKFNVHHSDKNSPASSDIVSKWSLPLYFLNPNFLSITLFPNKLYISFANNLLLSGKIKCFSRSSWRGTPSSVSSTHLLDKLWRRNSYQKRALFLPIPLHFILN